MKPTFTSTSSASWRSYKSGQSSLVKSFRITCTYTKCTYMYIYTCKYLANCAAIATDISILYVIAMYQCICMWLYSVLVVYYVIYSIAYTWAVRTSLMSSTAVSRLLNIVSLASDRDLVILDDSVPLLSAPLR